MLPGRDGFEILKALRSRGLQAPVLMLTARDAVADRVEGLDRGADDYLVKPFAFPELLARMRVLLRRGRGGELARMTLARSESRHGHARSHPWPAPARSDPQGVRRIAYLLRHAGELVSRGMLARDVWKETSRATSLDNVIDVHMTRLRRKVDGDAAARLIHTVRGVGFVLREGRP